MYHPLKGRLADRNRATGHRPRPLDLSRLARPAPRRLLSSETSIFFCKEVLVWDEVPFLPSSAGHPMSPQTRAISPSSVLPMPQHSSARTGPVPASRGAFEKLLSSPSTTGLFFSTDDTNGSRSTIPIINTGCYRSYSLSPQGLHQMHGPGGIMPVGEGGLDLPLPR